MKPLISIIMPVFNCEDFIEESVRSICDQTYTNWELIIVNDASTDATSEKIAQIEDERIQVINLNEHLGLTAAFAIGYKNINGEYVVRQDADDISAPKRLELQEEYLSHNPKLGMVSCLISCFTRDPLYRRDCIFVERIQNYYKNYDEITKATSGGFMPVLFPTLMIRKSIMDNMSYETSNLDFDDHIELLLELIKSCEVEKVNTVLYHYRRHNKAYHIVNQKIHEECTLNLLKNPVIKNHLQYNDFYKNAPISGNEIFTLNEDSPIRVLMLIDALNVGGTETHVLNITKALLNMGIYVVAATSGGPMEGVFQANGIKTIRLPMNSDYISNKKKLGMIKLLKNIVDEEKINLIHCHLFASMQLASELYRLYNIPYIVTIHGLFYPNDILYSSCLKASKVIAVSEPVRKMLDEKLGNRIKDKIIVIPNGINSDIDKQTEDDLDVRKELRISNNAKIICYCSRLDWNKTEAARVFLFSFSQLIKDFPNLHAVIIGDGPGKEGLEKEAQVINQTADKKVVHVIGAKVNVIPYFLESTIIIGTARIALEGMMCRKPVIAIGNQGYTGIISERSMDNQWQMYFGDHDALEKPNITRLAKDIKLLMWDSETRRRIGTWSRKWCEQMFNNDKVVNEIINVYEKALNS